MAKIEDHGEDPDALKDLEQHWERFMVRVPWWMGSYKISGWRLEYIFALMAAMRSEEHQLCCRL